MMTTHTRKQLRVTYCVDPEGDFLQEGTQLVAQLAIELEAEQLIGAERHERSTNRKNHRNGYRERGWEK